MGKISKGDAIAYRETGSFSQEVKLQSKVASEKIHPQTVDTDNQTFNCDNADGHSQTGNRKNIGE